MDGGEQTQIDDLLDRWEEAQAEGHDLSPEDLCAACPHLLPTLKRQIGRLRQLERVLDPDDSPKLHEQSNHENEVEVHATFTNFKLIDEGGLGTVYSALDDRLRREVAIKFLQPRHLAAPTLVNKFRDEAEITGRLDHPGIVPIYGFGCTAEGQPYYVMRRIHGETLDQRAAGFHDGNRDDPEARIRFRQLLAAFVAVCRAIMYAHRRGVVHADLKPKNIVLGKHGETIVLDWGLAAAIGKDEHHQNTDEATLRLRDVAEPGSPGAGTWGYMSPEQHSGLPAGTSTDIYALGATLYFILTGRPAFDPQQPAARLREQVLRGRFNPPRQLNHRISPQLDAICGKAMALVPSERYRTADELGDDVERYFADEPVTAFPESPATRGLRWLRHHRNVALLVIVAATLAIASLSAISLISATFARREHQALLLAETARNRGLGLAAQFAADLVARQTQQRWQMLALAAAEPELVGVMQAVNGGAAAGDDQLAELDTLLQTTERNFATIAGEPESWFICDASGRQVARVPASERSLGKSFAGRDYFHANGRDLAASEVANPRHISEPHRSQPYVSTTTGAIKIALTVPIASPTDEFLGILGISVSLGEFHELQLNLKAGQRVMVVDLGENRWSDRRHDGLVLYHPAMQRQTALREPIFHQLDPGLTEKLRAAPESVFLADFADPLDRDQGEWIGTACRVVMPEAKRLSPWVVIVSECCTLTEQLADGN